MMDLLHRNDLRKKILTYAFTHPDESYYVRELAGVIGADPGNLSRELRKLEEEGLYTSRTRGRNKNFLLNKNHPLFDELKAIIFKTSGVEGSLKELLTGFKGITRAFIYGSYAKDKEKKDSDIDLAVVGEVSRDEFTRQIRKLEKELKREINFTLYAEKEFKEESEKAGGFLNIVLKGKVIILKGSIRG